MTTFWLNVGWCIVGYVAAIFTWSKVKEIVNGAEAEYMKLKANLDKLRTKF